MAKNPGSAPIGGTLPAQPKGAGRAFYAPRFDEAASPRTASRYIFFSSQRTGSTYLCRRLCNIKHRLGLPSEYLNPIAIGEFAPRLVAPGKAPANMNLGDYLHGVERLRTTADGAFGIKVQPKQLLSRFPAGSDGVLKFLQGYERIVVLTRRDKLGQAVSGAIAEATGDWATGAKPPDMGDEELAKLCPDVAFKLNRYVQEELRMLAVASKAGRPWLHIEYEEILSDPENTFDNLLKFLGEPRGVAGVEEGDLVSVPKKSGGELARRLGKRFLDFITAAGPYSVPRAARR
jgi:LPS sulfotransferase NodH